MARLSPQLQAEQAALQAAYDAARLAVKRAKTPENMTAVVQAGRELSQWISANNPPKGAAFGSRAGQRQAARRQAERQEAERRFADRRFK